ncbi:PAS domain-containing protein [bacterium]|nr:PAS domain-containing protein [bacterium]
MIQITEYEKYFNAMPGYVTVQDRDLKVIAANEKYRSDFGDWEGRFCYQVYKHRPDKCEVCPVEKTFQFGNSRSSEEVVCCMDGREVSVIVYTSPIYNDEGEIEAVLEMSTDITDVKSLQHRYQESQNHYRMMFEEVPCFISIQDDELNIIDANRLHREAFGNGYGRKCFEVYKHRKEECTPCIVKQTFEDGEIHYHEEVVTRQDDQPINVLVHTTPIRDAEGKIVHVMEMSTDITQIRELQSQLASLGLLISSVSHGIKGVLNGLDGGLYLVNKGLEKDNQKRVEQGWDIVTRNVGRIRSMVLDILYYAKDRDPNYSQISAEQSLKDVFDLVKDKAYDLGIGLTKEIDQTCGELEADESAIRSLLVNLAENSLDACRVDAKKSDHKVQLRVWGATDEVVFEIEDNGIGMERETRDKAFSLFFSSKGTEGTGLGLFIANKIATAHGGEIQLDSCEGEGTCFRVIIPRKKNVTVVS